MIKNKMFKFISNIFLYILAYVSFSIFYYLEYLANFKFHPSVIFVISAFFILSYKSKIIETNSKIKEMKKINKSSKKKAINKHLFPYEYLFVESNKSIDALEKDKEKYLKRCIQSIIAIILIFEALEFGIFDLKGVNNINSFVTHIISKYNLSVLGVIGFITTLFPYLKEPSIWISKLLEEKQNVILGSLIVLYLFTSIIAFWSNIVFWFQKNFHLLNGQFGNWLFNLILVVLPLISLKTMSSKHNSLYNKILYRITRYLYKLNAIYNKLLYKLLRLIFRPGLRLTLKFIHLYDKLRSKFNKNKK